MISIHALREEGDTASRARGVGIKKFLSTPSARRATIVHVVAQRVEDISIHALREEGDRIISNPVLFINEFLSTPSARRATKQTRKNLFYTVISIHALREEGDAQPVSIPVEIGLFLSTPSARRATLHVVAGQIFFAISIHALREEGDMVLAAAVCSVSDFYPRPPRGGRPHFLYGSSSQQLFLSTPSARRATIKRSASSSVILFLSTPSARRATCHAWSHGVAIGISIHALREEGDFFASTLFPEGVVFLSTPSARRATTAVSFPASCRDNFYPRPPRGGRPGR